MRHQIFTTLSTFVILVLAPFAHSQGLDESLFTVGTTLEDTDEDGAAWVYLLWQSEDLETLKDRSFAIYSKLGEPSSLNTYVYEGTARTRLDPAAIVTLINRGIELGDEVASLESDIDALFEKIVPDGTLPLAEKISVVVESCLLDPELFENLIFLSRTHPALSLVLGTGFAVKHTDGEIRTWEIRECPVGYDNVDDDCDSVVGRITLRVGDYIPLPAPGRPVYIPFVDNSGNPDPRAHLNIPLRWSTPDDLRLRSLLQFGYNLYRMDAQDAIDANFDSVPPTPTMLFDLASNSGHSTTRVNSVPILVDSFLSEAEAANVVLDPETYFIIDDNDRYDLGGVPFVSGDEYYYFLTARDILGRDGEVSEGTPVQICDFQPPPQPRNLKVTNHYSFDAGTSRNTQHFKVEWSAPDTSNTETPETISGYQVYRWWSIEEMQQNASFPFDSATATEGGLVATLPASQTVFVDDGVNAPFLAVERLPDGTTNVDQGYANKTFWYTVRAMDSSACGGNLSGNSTPVFGVLRDRIGPPKPTGFVELTCYDIRVIAPREVVVDSPFEPEPELGIVYLTLQGTRLDNYIKWVEFSIYEPQAGTYTLLETRHIYSASENVYTIQLKLPQPTDNDPLYIACRMGNQFGKVSAWNSLEVPIVPNEFSAYRIDWEGESIENIGIPNQVCDVHVPFGPGQTLNGITLEFDLTPSTEEWKVYRRIDDGKLTLIQQGLDSALDSLTAIVEDLNMPAKDARVCYFVQLFDQHGNPSPIVRIACIDVQGKEPLPAPMLAPPFSVGDESAPEAVLGWFCPPYGIEFFELYVSVEEGDLPTAMGDDFQSAGTDVVEADRTWRPFLTKRVPATFTGNSPEFGTQINGIVLGETYTFKVRAIGPSGSTGPFSNVEEFTWNPDSSSVVSGPDVPWPALGLPFIQNNFNDGILARTVPEWLFDGGAVRVGLLNYAGFDFSPNGENPSDFFFPPNVLDPLSAFYKNDKGEALFPFVLYRFQVENSEYPVVSGDVYQVSPMMESIPTVIEVNPSFGASTHRNYDPFIFVAQNEDIPGASSFIYDLLMKDTQPVISGASYRYLIVRFDPVSKEIVEVIPTNTVTIP
ncbi:hypothetical protein G0Q06_01180 [Puniceicoccales bacterium CK1056]|uniref:Fibronectin type-III domain-containing protein n=1 Tax=Oceanipulchritudo coccoides TaxID=2706888 RepID=A0A6B2LZX8_9BACT|nr:hypothetical protein [Oceanipulchritudo coccoides]NDV61055.1 hypothetical protein [Oceanipulchritudo coccoides]